MPGRNTGGSTVRRGTTKSAPYKADRGYKPRPSTMEETNELLHKGYSPSEARHTIKRWKSKSGR